MSVSSSQASALCIRSSTISGVKCSNENHPSRYIVGYPGYVTKQSQLTSMDHGLWDSGQRLCTHRQKSHVEQNNGDKFEHIFTTTHNTDVQNHFTKMYLFTELSLLESRYEVCLLKCRSFYCSIIVNNRKNSTTIHHHSTSVCHQCYTKDKQ